MTKQKLLKILDDKLETYKLDKDTKEIWLIPYEGYGIDAICDIAQNEQELKELLEYHEQANDNYRIVKLVKGE
jgi:hypothetical protein